VNIFKQDATWFDIGRVDDFLKLKMIAWDEQSLAFAPTAAARGNTTRRGALMVSSG
jgi:hypothetical protein